MNWFGQLEGWEVTDMVKTKQEDEDGETCDYPVQILIGNEKESVFDPLNNLIKGLF